MDSIINRIVTLAEPAREKQYRRYLGTMTNRDLVKKLADLEAEAGRPAPEGTWRMAARRTEIKIS